MEYIKEKSMYGNRSKGTPPTPQINSWARKLQAEWMLTHNPTREKLGYQTLRSIPYIQECISWNLDQNFDRVSAANMVFIARADRVRVIEGVRNGEEQTADYNNDPFFKDNYSPFDKLGYGPINYPTAPIGF